MNNLTKNIAASILLSLAVSVYAEDGPVVIGTVNTNVSGDGAITASSIMSSSSASVEVGSVTGRSNLTGDLNTNYSMQGATTASAVQGCASVRIGSIADQPLCKSGGGGILGALTGLLGF